MLIESTSTSLMEIECRIFLASRSIILSAFRGRIDSVSDDIYNREYNTVVNLQANDVNTFRMDEMWWPDD